MKISSWNVNSVRARILNITSYLKTSNPDILMIQEIKTETKIFTFFLATQLIISYWYAFFVIIRSLHKYSCIFFLSLFSGLFQVRETLAIEVNDFPDFLFVKPPSHLIVARV